jgi:hypothetical protein
MSKKIIKILAAVFLLSAVFGVAKLVLAAAPDLGMSYGSAIGLAATDPRIIIARIIQIFLGFLGIIAIGLIMYGGFLWMTAAGNEEQIDRAKKTLVSALIGLAIILSAFAIATFLLNSILQATGLATPGENGGGPGATINGAGAMGECSVDNVYPTPGQTNVARNTSLIVTFKEDVNPATICQSAPAGVCGGSLINTSNVKIYNSVDDPTKDASLLKDVQVFNSDKKTFVLYPKNYLGSPTDLVSYIVHLTNDVKAAAGGNIFDSCQPNFLEWKFEVSNKIDLTPPQVVSGGVFPPPDSSADTPSAKVSAQAAGSITVNSNPQIYAKATSTAVTKGDASFPDVSSVSVDPGTAQGGKLTIAVGTGGVTATLHNDTENIPLGAADFNGKTIDFPGIISLTVSKEVAAGNSWTVTVSAAKQADTLTVGSTVYTFVSANNSQPNQIAMVAGNTSATAQNIAAAIHNFSSEADAVAAGNKITVTARHAGAAGNGIVLASSDGASLAVAAMADGVDGGTTITAVGQPDAPRNSVIQINFNEPVFPNNVAGDADSVSKVIRITNANSNKNGGDICSADNQCKSFKCSAGKCVGNYLAGNFTIANQYRTVEFKSDNECGVNGCGQKIYCLPENSNLKVQIDAASLAACSGNDCAAKTPYTTCSGNCKNVSVTPAENYPVAAFSAQDGVMDLCFNSLDGNRNSNAQGPLTAFNQNNPADQSVGDSFTWSFFVGNKLDITPPTIKTTNPSPSFPTALSLTGDVRIFFSKLMLASSLKTGSTKVDNGTSQIIHKNMNLWSLSGSNVGYWIESSSTLINGVPASTTAAIRHSSFQQSLSYQAQVGSGVDDIFQNCYKPSAGQACAAGTITAGVPSCCNGTATADLGLDGNCP